MKDKLLDKIKSRGYWRINFQPVVATEKFKKLSDCKEIVEKCTVSLRGWDYPHFPHRQDEESGLDPGNNYYQGWIDWWSHKELWRMYQSGQYIHYVALRDDWLEDDGWYREEAKKIKPFECLGVIGSVVYQLTEVFEFLSRLSSANVYDEGVNVSISLNNTKNRKLWLDDSRRIGFSHERNTGAETIEIPNKYYTKDIILVNAKENAFEAIKYVFDRFGWHDLPEETIRKDQDNLLMKKFN